MEFSVSEELLAQAIGREVLKCVSEEGLAQKVECGAVRLLEEIRHVLDDDSLDDPACFQKIEAIAAAFRRCGLYTSWHDYG